MYTWPYLAAPSHHLEVQFPDVVLNNVFSISDPTEMPQTPMQSLQHHFLRD